MNNSCPLNKYKYAIKHMVKRFIKDDVTAFAAESTYYFILGLVPFLVFSQMQYCFLPHRKFK